MKVTQAAIDEYNQALVTITKTKKMLDDIKKSIDMCEPEPEPECNYDIIIEMLIANGNIKYRE